MDIHPYVIQSRSELGSKNYTFMENDKIISITSFTITFTVLHKFTVKYQ